MGVLITTHVSFQLTTIFIDVEGAYAEELAAIAVNSDTLEITDVFHEFAKSQAADEWCRKHVHGLNKQWLLRYANYENQTELVNALREWLRGKNVLTIFANNVAKEQRLLRDLFNVYDLYFPMWPEREKRASHRMAFLFKRAFIPVLNKRCCADAHSSFAFVPIYRRTPSEFAKRRWGVHCALYDCYEEYLFFVEERALPVSWLKH